MPTSFTLKNIPDDVYERLRKSAEAHHRSLNGEAIACLERSLAPHVVSAEERVERARKLRRQLGWSGFDEDDVAAAIREGRP